MKTYVFPGQGSQAKGMGASLFDRFPDLTKKADIILGYSIKELCLEDPRRELHQTRFTQPALYVVNALSYQAKVEDTGSEPDFVAGHSLGEFNALLAAKCFDFGTGLKLVKKRGELMSNAPRGAMAAILNVSPDNIERLLKENGLDKIDIANINTYSQVVISGAVEQMGKAESLFQQGNMRYYPLNTSGAFHSRYMKPASEKFAIYLKKFKFSGPQISVISNVTAKPYKAGEVVDNLATQISSRVRWLESILYTLKLAAHKGANMEIEEVGFGGVLTKIVAKIREETAHTINEIRESAADKSTNPAQALIPSNASETEAKKVPPAATPRKSKPSAREKVTEWNGRYPVGTRVKSLVGDYEELETRTEALVLFGHRAAVYMQNYKGYFDLDEVQPA